MPQRHAFWVIATDNETLDSSYKDIFEAIRKGDPNSSEIEAIVKAKSNPEGVLDPEASVSILEDWLQDSKNGQWIIVLDDVCDNISSSKGSDESLRHLDLKKLQNHGQILITTRHRPTSLKMIQDLTHRYVELSVPSLTDRLDIYNHFVESIPTLQNHPDAKDLLRNLGFPELIRKAVSYMQSKSKSPKELQKTIENEEFGELEGSDSNILEKLLSHHLPNGSLPSNAKALPNDIQYLLTLAMFGREGAKLEILKGESKNEQREFEEAQSSLKNSYLIRKDDKTGTITIEQTVGVAIRSWIKKSETETEILNNRLNKMYSMMHKFYRSKPNERNHKLLVTRDWMPQCEGFLRFVNDCESKPQSTDGMEFEPNAVRTIIEFSRQLYESDRYEDAAKILDFTRMRYSVNVHLNNPRVGNLDPTQLSIQYWLEHQLITTYLSYAMNVGDNSPNYYWQQAKEMIESRIEEAKTWDIETQTRFQDYMWMLILDQARVLCQLKEWDTAKSCLKSMDGLEITVQHINGKEEPNIAEPQDLQIDDNANDKKSLDRKEQKRKDFRKLAIQRKWIEGLIDLEQGDHKHGIKEEKEAENCWKLAENSLSIAAKALEVWLPDLEPDMHNEIAVSLAETHMKLRKPRHLKGPRGIFERGLADAIERYGSDCKRVWDMECRINAVRLKTDSELEQAVRDLERLKGKYEGLGKQVPATVRCRKQLDDAKARLHAQKHLYTIVAIGGIAVVGISGILLHRCKFPRVR